MNDQGLLGRVRLAVVWVAVAAALALGGCASAGRAGPYAPQPETDRDPDKAQRLTMQAADLINSDPAKAESLLREALTADLYHGPAHNDLGVIFLKQGALYQAASEFEWARKMLPGLPEPRMNLALTLEKAGRTDDAIAAYKTALEVYPGHMASMQALSRLQLRSGKADDHTPELLHEIALRGENERWREWARLQAARTARPRANE